MKAFVLTDGTCELQTGRKRPYGEAGGCLSIHRKPQAGCDPTALGRGAPRD